MIINGKYAKANIFAKNLDELTIQEITTLCNQPFVQGSKIAIMPDAHYGKGCVIGTTMTITDCVVPNLVGVDIGCGMLVVFIGNEDIDFQKLDDVIKKNVPSGFNVRQEESFYNIFTNVEDLKCYKKLRNIDKIRKSIGTLGGGNHFIEINQCEDGYFLVIHSGSRNLGHQVCTYYQNLANEKIKQKMKNNLNEIIQFIEPRFRQDYIIRYNQYKMTSSKDLAYLTGSDLDDYLHDMKIVQEYAHYNRKAIAYEICRGMNWESCYDFSTIHNYIDVDNKILRKGAISAQLGERIIIPLNMRDGSIIGVGKGNPEWNYSGPHGAGRIMSRSEAAQKITLEEFQKSMSDVWSTSVTTNTIDESPMAYKPAEQIIESIKDNIHIIDIIKPVYNYKAH